MWWNHSWIRQFHKPNGTRKSLSWWKKGSQGWQSPLFIVEQKTKSRSPVFCKASLVVQWVKNPPAMKETQVRSLGWFDPWVGFNPWVRKIPWRKKWQPTPVFLPEESPWKEEPGGLQSTGSKRVGLDWACTHTYYTHKHIHILQEYLRDVVGSVLDHWMCSFLWNI